MGWDPRDLTQQEVPVPPGALAIPPLRITTSSPWGETKTQKGKKSTLPLFFR